MEGIKVGDLVLIESTGFKDYLTKVTKVTSKQFVTTNGNRFWKKNGRLVGSGEWDSMYASLPSKETVDQIIESRKKLQLLAKLTEYLKTKDIPIEVLESVVNLLES
jgi:hypothetical protein